MAHSKSFISEFKIRKTTCLFFLLLESVFLHAQSPTSSVYSFFPDRGIMGSPFTTTLASKENVFGIGQACILPHCIRMDSGFIATELKSALSYKLPFSSIKLLDSSNVSVSFMLPPAGTYSIKTVQGVNAINYLTVLTPYLELSSLSGIEGELVEANLTGYGYTFANGKPCTSANCLDLGNYFTAVSYQNTMLPFTSIEITDSVHAKISFVLPEAGNYKLYTSQNIYIQKDLVVRAKPLSTFAPKLIWASKINGGQINTVPASFSQSRVMDSKGNFFITGYIVDTAYFDSVGKIILYPKGSNTAFFAKYNALGECLWAKSIESSLSSYANAITLDEQGNIYLTGSFNGVCDFDPSPTGVFARSSTTYQHTDTYFAKYDPMGNFLWAKTLMGEVNDGATSIQLDKKGNIYLAGSFSNGASFDPTSSSIDIRAHPPGYADAFIAKYTNDGQFVWVKNMGGAYQDFVSAMLLDMDGNQYITGVFSLTADFDPSSAIYNLQAGANMSIFLAKYDSTGNFVWAKALGDTTYSQNIGRDLCFDHQGNVIVVGVSNSHAFLAKLTKEGGILWQNKVQGSINEAQAVAVDSKNQVYVTGSFTGTIYFDGSGVPDANVSVTSNAWMDLFLAKFDSKGKILGALNMGGSDYDCGYNLWIDGADNLFLKGNFYDTMDVDPSDKLFPLATSQSLNNDVFIAKYSLETLTTHLTENSSEQSTTLLYPNPTKGVLYIKGEYERARIITLMGESRMEQESNGQPLDMTALPKGIYIVQIKNKGKIDVQKIILE